MLTEYAMTGFKNYVKRNVSYCKYKIGSTYYQCDLTDVYIDDSGNVVIDITIDPEQTGSVTITEIQLYDVYGQLWLSKTENITRKSIQEGVFKRFSISITEV